ncbi:MAG: rRNA (cytosine1402-N4)-methyltransferase [Chthoniobacter sp.]|jgi:16S rRNA (cytosine1402-N4)-methyltransferase|nr:rRNA (cytosine1402-N4)-methyltransferase [Chthoniobacter sp.]
MTEDPAIHKRRKRYRGKNPRHFAEKYKENDPGRYGTTVAKVLASGKTPAGTHRPIMVEEIVAVLAPRPGEFAVDCTLGYGGHAAEVLARIQPRGKLLGLDADPIELPKTEARLRALGFGQETFVAVRSNFAGLPQILPHGADIILADLGVSSMQIDNPARGFSVKYDGPLDMRMNPHRGEPASAMIKKIRLEALAALLVENADEPHAAEIAAALAGKIFATTTSLAAAVREALPRGTREGQELSTRRVFQALRIAVNDEFSALETFLRNLPACLKPGGRVAILTFHSGEDRRVKKALEAGLRGGDYDAIAPVVIRPTAAERNSNPRSAPAKLRWARKA